MQFRLPFSDDGAKGELPPEGGSVGVAQGRGTLPNSRSFRLQPDENAGARKPPRTVSLQANGFSFIVHFVRMRRARRYILRVRPDGALRVTIPRGGSRTEALRFAERHLPWAARERARQQATRRSAVEWHVGMEILLDGVPAQITRDGDVVHVGPIAARVTADVQNLRPALEHAMREAATRSLPNELLALAARHGLTVTRVTIRNQRSRWGSCSRDGRIALNFRLLQMPPAVREYILLHELTHLRHPNHSRRFWRAVEAVCPAFRGAERWLRRSGHDLF